MYCFTTSRGGKITLIDLQSDTWACSRESTHINPFFNLIDSDPRGCLCICLWIGVAWVCFIQEISELERDSWIRTGSQEHTKHTSPSLPSASGPTANWTLHEHEHVRHDFSHWQVYVFISNTNAAWICSSSLHGAIETQIPISTQSAKT